MKNTNRSKIQKRKENILYIWFLSWCTETKTSIVDAEKNKISTRVQKRITVNCIVLFYCRWVEWKFVFAHNKVAWNGRWKKQRLKEKLFQVCNNNFVSCTRAGYAVLRRWSRIYSCARIKHTNFEPHERFRMSGGTVLFLKLHLEFKFSFDGGGGGWIYPLF